MNRRSRRVERKIPESDDVQKKGKSSMPPKSEATPSMPKFSLQLTKEEIRADILAMTGREPKSRPTRRPKAVQKYLNTMSLGMSLKEQVTVDMYKVPEPPEPVKENEEDKDESV